MWYQGDKWVLMDLKREGNSAARDSIDDLGRCYAKPGSERLTQNHHK